MPRFVLVRHASAGDDLVALDATGGKLILVTARAVDVVLARNERFGADRRLADDAAETLLVPLTSFVLHLLGTCAEHFAAAIAASGEGGIVAVGAVDLLVFRSERFVHQ